MREWYGYLLIILMFLSMLAWILFGFMRKYRADLVARFVDLSSRSLDSARSLYRRNQRAKELERLKPKLFAIQRRLEQLQDKSGPIPDASTFSILSSSKTSSTPLSIQDSGKVHYNAGLLFDTLDKDHNERLDFEELQRVLELNPEQLEVFVKRMNELAGNETTTSSVTRPVFVKYFLRVLEETSHFGPTPSEVEELFNELSQGNDLAAYVDFFDSRLAVFLSDPQINHLIAEFRKYAVSEDVASNRRKSNFTISSGGIQEQPTDSSNLMHAESGVPSGYRPAIAHKFSMGSLFGMQDAKRFIHRDVFCRYYAELLARVTDESIPESDAQDRTQSSRGVDLAFEDLSLEVTVGEKKVNVVNKVSGRLPARTMTALMGGSGKWFWQGIWTPFC